MFEVSISPADFDIGEEYQAISSAASISGAVVFFVGLVRDLYSDDAQAAVSHLELQHYPGMTESLCLEILESARLRFDLEAAKIVHRVGTLDAGDQIVFVACAGRHRDSAFAAAEYIMDYLKTRATFWKKEVGDKGQQWLGVKEKDRDAAERWEN